MMFNMASVRHLDFGNFWFFVTFPSLYSKFASAYQISSNLDDSRLRYGVITIFKMAAVRLVGFSKFDIFIICDRALMISYWRSIVTMALSRVVSEISNVEKCRDNEMGLEVTQGHWKWYHSVDRVWFPIVMFLVTVPKTHRFWHIRLQKCCDLENRVRGTSRSLEISPLDKSARLPTDVL